MRVPIAWGWWGAIEGRGVRGALRQCVVVLLINVPALSFGLALGWVSLVGGETGGAASGDAVIAAVTTLVACFVGVPLGAKAITYGRKYAIVGASACFVVCWSLKLLSLRGSPWWMVGGRVAAGLGGAVAWAVEPLLAREMCSAGWRGAAVSALPLAHSAGVLLMYLAADAALAFSTVMWWCLAVALGNCFVILVVPESPCYLAANGRDEEARVALAWLRGLNPSDPALEIELKTLPVAESRSRSALALAADLVRDKRRRVALMVGSAAVVGQEACGVFAVLQYAEPLFALARDFQDTQAASPARLALMLGATQLAASALSLYLVERLGRRSLLVWCAWSTGAALAAAGAAQWTGATGFVAPLIALAVATDAAGLQSAPYALLADMFHYEYRGCALMLVTAAACIGNAIEVGVFPAVAVYGGVATALGLAAALTLTYAAFATIAVPETRGKSLDAIYDVLCPRKARGDRSKRPEGVQAADDCACRLESGKNSTVTRL